jgi:branched-chain amino acid transport system ATP-binding protein
MALLELRQVEAAYGPIKALHGVDVEVPDGSIVALLGANGAGKTTTLRAITGMVRARGRIRFDGRDVLNHRPEEVTRQGVAHVPEGRGTLAQLTVWENLQMGAYIRRDREGVKRDLERIYGYFPWMEQRRRQVASRAYVLEVGRVVLEGTSQELARNESMRNAYLGY